MPVIAYLTSLYGRAADTFVRREVLELRRRGYTVYTFSIRRPDSGQSVGEAVRNEQRRTDYILEHGWGRLFVTLLLEAITNGGRLWRAVRLAARVRAPGLRGAVWQGAYLVEGAYLARRLRALGVQHVHNHIPANSASVCMLAAELAGVSWSMTVHGPTIFYEPMRWALPAKIAHAAFTACITSFCRSQCMLFAEPADWWRLKIVRCGLDGDFLDRTPPSPPPTAPRLVFVGRLCHDKGPMLLVEAAAELHREGVPVELTLVGDGEIRPAVEAAAERRGLSGYVQLLGWRDSEGVRQAILNSRALVLPSFAEGLPVVIMEALALHRPVISTYIAGIPELVQAGESGWLVPAGDVEALAAAMREAVEASPDRLEEMGRTGAERVRRRHDAATEVAKLDDLIREAIDEPHREPAVPPQPAAGDVVREGA